MQVKAATIAISANGPRVIHAGFGGREGPKEVGRGWSDDRWRSWITTTLEESVFAPK